MKPSTSTSAAAAPYAKYLNGMAVHRRGVPVQALGPVEAGRPQLDPAEVRLADQVVPLDLATRGDGRQPLLDLVAGVLDRAAVEVRAGAGGGGGGVRHLVGAGRRQPDLLQRDAERGRGDLDHLGVQALAHLGAAVVDQHRAVLVDVHERAGLVEGREVEGDAELHRRERQRPLGVRVASRCTPRCRRAGTRPGRSVTTWSQASPARSGCRTGWPYGVAWPST